MRVDAALFAQKFETRTVYGPGGAFHLSFFNYALEIVASGGWYHTPDDPVESWNVRVDTRVNLPAGTSPFRPYIGLGIDRTTDEGVRNTSGAALGGLYLRFPFGERVIRCGPIACPSPFPLQG